MLTCCLVGTSLKQNKAVSCNVGHENNIPTNIIFIIRPGLRSQLVRDLPSKSLEGTVHNLVKTISGALRQHFDGSLLNIASELHEFVSALLLLQNSAAVAAAGAVDDVERQLVKLGFGRALLVGTETV